MLRSAARNKVTGYRIAGALRRAAVPMRSLSLLSVLLSVTLLSVSILSATLLSGCAKPVREPKIVTVLDPTEINHLSLGGMVVTAHRDQAISPDSKYLLMGLLGNTSDRMVAVPIDVPGNEDNGAVSLYSADTAWTHNNLLTLMPVGWLSNTECLFIVHGWQDQGPNRGDRGTSIYLGDVETGTSILLGYVAVPEQGQHVDDAVLTHSGKLYLRVAERFWEFDVASQELNLIRDDLPTYVHGIFNVEVSPTGDHVVYGVGGEEKSGVYIMNTATGEESLLMPTGDSMSFYPSWSPDGRYIALYTASKVTNPSMEGVTTYKYIPGEDGPFPSAESITILDVEGNIVETLKMEGQFLSSFAWLADSKSLVYLAGTVTFGKWGEVRSREYESVWIEDIYSDLPAVKVADIAAIEEDMLEHTNYIYPVASLPDGQGALLNIAGANSTSVWRVSKDKEPVKVASGWWETPRFTPFYNDRVVGLVSDGGESDAWLVGSEELDRHGSYPAGTTIAAYSEDLLVLTCYDFQAKQTEVWVYDMLSEKVEE
jgi:hypothetical protein